MANRQLKFLHEKLKKFKKWQQIGLPMQKKVGVYFEVQKIMYLRLFNINFEQVSKVSTSAV